MRWLIVLFLFNISGYFHRDPPIMNGDAIARIEIASMHWNATTKGRLTPDVFWSSQRASAAKQVATDLTFYTAIEDTVFLNAVNDRLSRSSFNVDSGGIDVRVSCLLIRSNQRTDTLSFGPVHAMQINSKYYDLDTSLLKIIAEKLPERHQEIISRDLQ